MFPNGKHRPDMTEEEMAAKADEIVAQVMRKREARLAQSFIDDRPDQTSSSDPGR